MIGRLPAWMAGGKGASAVLAAVVFVATLLTYLPSVRYEFVTYDDHEYVFTNRCVLAGLSCGGVRWAFGSCGYANNWHPLAWISLQADASVVRADPGDERTCATGPLRRLSALMHGHNAVLHAANAALLFVLIVLMARRFGPPDRVPLQVVALFALLWAIHPLRTEVVCWVSERKELVSVFFMLLAMIAWVGGSRSRSCTSGEDAASPLIPHPPSLIPLFFFALALLAKPVAVSLPVVLFAWDWVMAGRRFGRSLAASVPFLLLSAGACVLTMKAQSVAVGIGEALPLLDRIVMSLAAPVVYLRQTFWPVGLSVFYSFAAEGLWIEAALGAVLVVAMAAVSVVWLFRRRPPVLSLLVFAVAWCYVSLVPMLGIVKIGDHPHCDRYTYWAGCGLAAVAALACCRAAKGFAGRLAKALAVVLAVLVFATEARMSVWRDSFAFFLDGALKSWASGPVCSLSHILRRQGEEGARRAEAMLRTAVNENGHIDIRAEFAHVLAVRSRKSDFTIGEDDPAFAEAAVEIEAVLGADPDHPVGNEAMAVVEMKRGRWESALRHLEVARKGARIVRMIDEQAALCRERMAAERKGSHVRE